MFALEERYLICLRENEDILVRFVRWYLESLLYSLLGIYLYYLSSLLLVLGSIPYLILDLFISLTFTMSLLYGVYPYSCCREVVTAFKGNNSGTLSHYVLTEYGHYKAKVSSEFQCSPNVRLVGSNKNGSTIAVARRILRIAPIIAIVERSRWILQSFWRKGLATGRKLHLPSVVTFHFRMGLISAVTGLHEMGVFFEVTVLRCNVVSSIENPAVSFVVHEA